MEELTPRASIVAGRNALAIEGGSLLPIRDDVRPGYNGGGLHLSLTR